MGIYPFGVHLLPIHIEKDLLKKRVVGKHFCKRLSKVWVVLFVFTYRASKPGFLKKDHKYRF
jgi:hypothetical protein